MCIADLAVIIMLSCTNPGSNCTTISNVTINCNNNNNVFNQRIDPTPGETATSFNFSQPAVSANTQQPSIITPSMTTPSNTTSQTQFVKPPIFNDLCNATPYNNSALQQQENLYKFNSLDFEFKPFQNQQSTTPQLPTISINDNLPNSLTSSSYTTPYKNESTYNNIISPITGSATPQLLDDKHNRTSKHLKIQYVYDKFKALWDPTLTTDDNYEILAELEKYPIFDPLQIDWNAALAMYQHIKVNQFQGTPQLDPTSAVYFNLTRSDLIPYVNWNKYIECRANVSINHNNKQFGYNDNLKLGPSHGVSGGAPPKVSASKKRRNRKKRERDGRSRQLQSSQQQSDDDDISEDNDEEMKDESTKDADTTNDNDQQESEDERDNNNTNDDDDDDDDDDDEATEEEDDDLNIPNNADNDTTNQDDNDIDMDDNNSEGLLYYIDFSKIFVYL